MEVEIFISDISQVVILDMAFISLCNHLLARLILRHEVYIQDLSINLVQIIEMLQKRLVCEVKGARDFRLRCHASLLEENGNTASNLHKGAAVSVVVDYLLRLTKIRDVSFVIDT